MLYTVALLWMVLLMPTHSVGIPASDDLSSLHAFIESLPPCQNPGKEESDSILTCLMQVEEGYQRCATDPHLCVCTSLQEVKDRCYAPCRTANNDYIHALNMAVENVCLQMYAAVGVVYPQPQTLAFPADDDDIEPGHSGGENPWLSENKPESETHESHFGLGASKVAEPATEPSDPSSTRRPEYGSWVRGDEEERNVEDYSDQEDVVEPGDEDALEWPEQGNIDLDTNLEGNQRKNRYIPGKGLADEYPYRDFDQIRERQPGFRGYRKDRKAPIEIPERVDGGLQGIDESNNPEKPVNKIEDSTPDWNSLKAHPADPIQGHDGRRYDMEGFDHEYIEESDEASDSNEYRRAFREGLRDQELQRKARLDHMRPEDSDEDNINDVTFEPEDPAEPTRRPDQYKHVVEEYYQDFNRGLETEDRYDHRKIQEGLGYEYLESDDDGDDNEDGDGDGNDEFRRYEPGYPEKYYPNRGRQRDHHYAERRKKQVERKNRKDDMRRHRNMDIDLGPPLHADIDDSGLDIYGKDDQEIDEVYEGDGQDAREDNTNEIPSGLVLTKTVYVPVTPNVSDSAAAATAPVTTPASTNTPAPDSNRATPPANAWIPSTQPSDPSHVEDMEEMPQFTALEELDSAAMKAAGNEQSASTEILTVSATSDAPNNYISGPVLYSLLCLFFGLSALFYALV